MRAWGWLAPLWTLSVTFQRTTSVPLGGPVLTIGVSRWSDVRRDWRSKYSSSLNPTMRPDTWIQHGSLSWSNIAPGFVLNWIFNKGQSLTSFTAGQQRKAALVWDESEWLLHCSCDTFFCVWVLIFIPDNMFCNRRSTSSSRVAGVPVATIGTTGVGATTRGWRQGNLKGYDNVTKTVRGLPFVSVCVL